MGGDPTRRETVTTTNSGGTGAQVIPELQPFVGRVGQLAYNALGLPQMQIGNYLGGNYLQVPPLSPLEQLSGQRIADRSLYGIPTPVPSQWAFDRALSLPGQVGQQVPMSPFMNQGLGTAQQIATQSGQSNPTIQSGLAGLQNFMGGGFNTSPAIQSALQGLESEIIPAVQNSAAKAGLSQSGFLPAEIGRTYARELVPLYMQGMQQGQSAAQAVTQVGLNQQDQQLRGLQSLRDTQMSMGQYDQALQTDAMVRQLQSTVAMSPELRALGSDQTQREIEAIKEAMSFGQLQRQNDLAQQQAMFDAYLRNQQIAQGFLNPYGNFPTAPGLPGQTVQNRTSTDSSAGWGFGK